MGFWSSFGKLVRTASKDFQKAGKDFIRATTPVVREMKAALRTTFDRIADAVRRGVRPEPRSEREQVTRDLEDVNRLAIRLRREFEKHGDLTPAQKEEWRRLKAKRERLITELQDIDLAKTAEDFGRKELAYEKVDVTEAQSHLIDMVSGQSTYGKNCPRCQRAMVLQFRRATAAPGLRDFYWGCSGWYVKLARNRSGCTYTEQLAPEDFSIFSNVKRTEFQVTANDLRNRVMDPGRRQRVRAALDAIKAQNAKDSIGVEQYRCPVHGENLRLRQKHEASDDLLDQYFLGCPMWAPGNTGCNFMIKLKSPARVAAVLQQGHRQDVFALLR